MEHCIIGNFKSIIGSGLRRLPGSRGFEAITNEAILPATKIHLLHHVIRVYVIIKMAAARTKAHCLVTRRTCYYCASIIKEDIH